VDDIAQDTSTVGQSVPTLDQPSNPTPDDASKHVVKDTIKSHKQKKRKHHEETDSGALTHKKRHTSKYWLIPHIRVRIISKDYCDGAYYNQKVINLWCTAACLIHYNR